MKYVIPQEFIILFLGITMVAISLYPIYADSQEMSVEDVLESSIDALDDIDNYSKDFSMERYFTFDQLDMYEAHEARTNHYGEEMYVDIIQTQPSLGDDVRITYNDVNEKCHRTNDEWFCNEYKYLEHPYHEENIINDHENMIMFDQLLEEDASEVKDIYDSQIADRRCKYIRLDVPTEQLSSFVESIPLFDYIDEDDDIDTEEFRSLISTCIDKDTGVPIYNSYNISSSNENNMDINTLIRFSTKSLET